MLSHSAVACIQYVFKTVHGCIAQELVSVNATFFSFWCLKFIKDRVESP